jgi:hypothetical protein
VRKVSHGIIFQNGVINHTIVENLKIKKEEAIRGIRNLHHEGLPSFVFPHQVHSSDPIRRINWVGHATHVEKNRYACKDLVAKPDRRSPLGTPEHRWEENIK